MGVLWGPKNLKKNEYSKDTQTIISARVCINFFLIRGRINLFMYWVSQKCFEGGKVNFGKLFLYVGMHNKKLGKANKFKVRVA